MPLALVPRYELTVTFAALDEESVIITRQKQYEIVGSDWATAEANRDLFLADLALSSGAQIVAHKMSELWVNNSPVTSTFNLYRELLLTVNLATSPIKKAAHTIIAPSLNFVNGTSLNLGHADVTAYLNNFLATGGIVTLSDGEFMTDANPVSKSRVKQVKSGVNYA